MKKIKVYLLLFLLSAFFSFIAIYKWFLGGTILYYWDALLPLGQSYAFAFLNNWSSLVFPGSSGSGLSWILYTVPIGILNNFFGISIAQGLIYFTLISLSIVNFYFLLRYSLVTFLKVSNKRVVFFTSFIFSLMYSFNLYTFYYAYFMFNPGAYIISFLPLNFLALIHLFSLDGKPKRNIFWVIIFFGTTFFMSPGFTTYIFFIQYLGWIFIYLVFYFLTSAEKRKSKFLKSFIFFILIIIANLWWFFPAYLGLQSSYSAQRFTTDPTAYIDLNSRNSNLLNSLRLIGSTMMTNNPFSWFSFYIDKNPLNIVLFFFPFLILFLVSKMKTLANKNYLLFFLIMFLVSVFLVKEGNPPRADITVWLFKYIPFFDAFRDAQHKAGLFYIFASFLLAGLGFYLLFDFLKSKKRKIYMFFLFFILFLLSLLVTGPFFIFSYDNVQKVSLKYMGNKFVFSAKTKIPNEYYELKKVLENKCGGKTTIVIPRATAITNAYWDKNGTSYMGQDVLSKFINCNLINNKIGENDPDAFANSAYLLLQNNDFPSFKNFLLQNDISLVLIRKDNIPFYYTSWFHVDPKKTIDRIEKDLDFRKLYENDFFNLYGLETNNLGKYGISTGSNIIFTNSPLTTATDYAIFAKALASQSGNFLINTNDNLKKFSNNINQYVSVANCVGCVQISSGDIFNENIKVSIIKQIKDFLKKFLKIDGLDESTDTKISKNLINSNLELARFIQEVKDNKIDDAKINRDNYLRDIKNVLKMLEDYEGSFFNKNQKLLETKNYLVAQNNSILKLLLAAFDDKRITESKIPLSVLLMSQKKGLDFINENIWQTDKENKVYRGRLDIASEGRYTCLVNSFTSNILPTKTYLNKDPSFLINNTQFFKEGSYPISIEYESLKITEVANLKIENIRELEIKGLGRGSYELSFNTEDIKSFLIVVFTNRKININNFGELLSNSLGENITFDYILPGDKVNANYEKNFFIDPISGENYYLYFIILEPYSTSLNEEVLKNLLIERNLEESDLNFYCVKTEERKKEVDKIEATKISNVEYKVKLPKNSSSKFLLFNQSYHDDWQAFSESNGEKLEHFRSGYGNAWYLPDNHDNEIKIVFSRQDLIIKNIFLSSILFFGLLFVFINKIKK